jgi:ketosteroid isomerase-like protein
MRKTKRRTYFWALASALIAVGAISAESDTAAEEIAMTMPTPVLASLAATASSGSAPMASDAAAARTAIERANAQWLAAFRTGDNDSLARIYAPDASLFPPSNVGLEGRDRIVEYFGAQRRAGMGDPSLKTLDVVCVGDLAYEVGTYGFRFDGNAGAGNVGDAGRYFAIWKGTPDGSWRYQVGIWSSNRDTDVIPR